MADSKTTLSQYAVDPFLFLDVSSLRESLKCSNYFDLISGLRMNTSKTEVLWVGSKKFSNLILCHDIKLDWSFSNFRYLSIDCSL